MITIEQALAATPEGFKLVNFSGSDGYATYEDRTGNKVCNYAGGYWAEYNGSMSNVMASIEEATAWIESKKRWWKLNQN